MLALVHIGPHKTGSTAFQHIAASNHAELLRVNLRYPEEYRGPGPGHHQLHKATRQSFDIAPQEASHNLLLSTETLCEHPAQLAMVNGALSEAGWKVAVVFVVRERSAVVLSRWKQLVKTGQTVLSFADYADRVMSGGTSPVCNQFQYLCRNHEIADLQLLSYEPAGACTLVKDLVTKNLGVEPVLWDAGRRNASLGFRETEMIRRLNQLTASHISRPRQMWGAVNTAIRDNNEVVWELLDRFTRDTGTEVQSKIAAWSERDADLVHSQLEGLFLNRPSPASGLQEAEMLIDASDTELEQLWLALCSDEPKRHSDH